MTDWLERLHEHLASPMPAQPPHLAMVGPPGVGKTHLGVGLYRHVVYAQDARAACWLDVPEFCNAVKRTYDEAGADDPFATVEAAWGLVVLDDLFGRDLSEHEVNNIVARLVATTYRNAAALVVTTNYGLDELQGKMMPHEVSRIFANAEVWNLKGQDRRL